MSLVYFHDWFPEESEMEPLVISLDREQAKQFDLPCAQFLLTEQICSNPECNCREVIARVVSSGFDGILGAFAIELAVDSLAVKRLTEEPENEYSGRIARLLSARMNADPRFAERLRRHYDLVKSRARRSETRRRFLSEARPKLAR